MSDYPKPKHRLFIDEITSIGAVADGDNPESEITFWKAHPEVEKQTQSERAADILEALISRERELRAVKRGVPVEQISRAKVLDFLVRDEHGAAAKAYAALLASKDEGDIALLKSFDVEKVFKQQLELFRQEKAEEPMSNDETVKEAVERVVKRWAFNQHMSRFGPAERGLTEEMIRAELWKSEPGHQLTNLLRSEYASEPLSKVKGTISKDAPQHTEALRMLDEGISI